MIAPNTYGLRHARILAALLIFSAACGSTSTEFATRTPIPIALPPPSSAPTAPASAPARRTELYYLAGSPVPLLEVAMGEHQAEMAADTGAGRHVLHAWLPREAGVALEPSAAYLLDAAGRRVPRLLAQHPRLTIDDWGTLADPSMAVMDPTPDTAAERYAGSISPQRLASHADAVVLDLEAGFMASEDYTAVAETLRRRGVALTREPVRACHTGQSFSFVASATVEGHSVQLEIDTGAPGTLLFATSAAAVALARSVLPVAADTPAYTRSGAHLSGHIPLAEVRIGDVVRRVDVVIAPDATPLGCPLDGFVGMNYLRGCVLAMTVDELIGRCAATPSQQSQQSPRGDTLSSSTLQ